MSLSEEHVFALECESREPDLAAERTCHFVARLVAAERDDYWLAEIRPPFIGQHFGLGAEMLNEVVLAAHLKGDSLFDADHRAIPVYVARIADREILATHTLMPNQIQVILWGQLRSKGGRVCR
jgi:hypothetical protein